MGNKLLLIFGERESMYKKQQIVIIYGRRAKYQRVSKSIIAFYSLSRIKNCKSNNILFHRKKVICGEEFAGRKHQPSSLTVASHGRTFITPLLNVLLLVRKTMER